MHELRGSSEERSFKIEPQMENLNGKSMGSLKKLTDKFNWLADQKRDSNESNFYWSIARQPLLLNFVRFFSTISWSIY